MAQYGRELVTQLLTNPKYLRVSDKTVPPEYNVANESPRPMFVQVDFGLVRNAKGELEPKLVELQAFPSLYGYQALSAQQYIDSLRPAQRPRHLSRRLRSRFVSQAHARADRRRVTIPRT